MEKDQNNRPTKRRKITRQDESVINSSYAIMHAMQKLISKLPEFKGIYSRNALIRAMNIGDHRGIVEMLENDYSFIDGKTVLGTAMLRWALINDYADIMTTLISRGINLNNTRLIHLILMRACIRGHADLVYKLLKYDGIHIETIDSCGHNALIKAIGFGRNSIAKMLLNYSTENPQIKIDMIKKALIWATAHNFHKAIHILISYLTESASIQSD